MAKSIANHLGQFWRDRAGVTSTEFGIVIGLIGLASLQALTMLGEEVEQNFDETGQTVAQSQADPFARGRSARIDPNEPATAGAQVAPNEPATAGAQVAPQQISEQTAKPVEPAFANSPPIEYSEWP
jgi:Flp pilus assembly pilin Flp